MPAIPPEQYEFSRLNIERFVMSKRWLKRFVDEGLVSGWDDPRMPTICGMRRRGYPAKAIMDFVQSTGVTKNVMTVPLSALEYYVRTELDKCALRVAVVEIMIKTKFLPLQIIRTMKLLAHMKLVSLTKSGLTAVILAIIRHRNINV